MRRQQCNYCDWWLPGGATSSSSLNQAAKISEELTTAPPISESMYYPFYFQDLIEVHHWKQQGQTLLKQLRKTIKSLTALCLPSKSSVCSTATDNIHQQQLPIEGVWLLWVYLIGSSGKQKPQTKQDPRHKGDELDWWGELWLRSPGRQHPSPISPASTTQTSDSSSSDNLPP